jgi:uncharacterized protein
MRMLEITQRGNSMTFAVRVQPRASRNSIDGEWQGALRVRLTEPPLDNRANEALRRLLAEYLEIPVTAVRILSGQHNRSKRVEVRGINSERIRALVKAPSHPNRE